MQFQELIQSSLTKHGNTPLKHFVCCKVDVTINVSECQENFSNFLMQFTELN